MVVIERGALATMLGDSENPAHTQWQKDGSKFKDKYYYGPAFIRFVADSVSEIVRISTEAEDQEAQQKDEGCGFGRARAARRRLDPAHPEHGPAERLLAVRSH